MRYAKRLLAFIMVFAVIGSNLSIYSVHVSAARNITFSDYGIVVAKGGNKKLKVRNANTKVKFSIISGKRNLTIKRRNKTSVVVRGKNAGVAKLQAKVGRKKIVCRVRVAAWPYITEAKLGEDYTCENPDSSESTGSGDKSGGVSGNKRPGTESAHNSGGNEGASHGTNQNAGLDSTTGKPIVTTEKNPNNTTEKSPDNITDEEPDNTTEKHSGTTTAEKPDINTEEDPDITTEEHSGATTDEEPDITTEEPEEEWVLTIDKFENQEDKNPNRVKALVTLFAGIERDVIEQNALLDLDGGAYLWTDGELTELYISDISLEGNVSFASFPYLTTLDCSYNSITGLNLNQNVELAKLDCSNNLLTSLNVSNNKKLELLYCEGNPITALNLSSNQQLAWLICNENVIVTGYDEEGIDRVPVDDDSTEEDPSGDGSKNEAEVAAFNDIFEEYGLDAETFYGLDWNENGNIIGIHINEMEDIKGDISFKAFSYLEILDCNNTGITKIDISSNKELLELSCTDNQLTQLDVTKNTKLAYLDCARNKITKLDVSKNLELSSLICDYNKVTALNLSKNTLLDFVMCDIGVKVTGFDEDWIVRIDPNDE